MGLKCGKPPSLKPKLEAGIVLIMHCIQSSRPGTAVFSVAELFCESHYGWLCFDPWPQIKDIAQGEQGNALSIAY